MMIYMRLQQSNTVILPYSTKQATDSAQLIIHKPNKEEIQFMEIKQNFAKLANKLIHSIPLKGYNRMDNYIGYRSINVTYLKNTTLVLEPELNKMDINPMRINCDKAMAL